LDTIRTRTDGGVLFAEIAAPRMNLLGPELVRDIVSLIRLAEGDELHLAAMLEHLSDGDHGSWPRH
jgi:hypothetical protein